MSRRVKAKSNAPVDIPDEADVNDTSSVHSFSAVAQIEDQVDSSEIAANRQPAKRRRSSVRRSSRQVQKKAKRNALSELLKETEEFNRLDNIVEGMSVECQPFIDKHIAVRAQSVLPEVLLNRSKAIGLIVIVSIEGQFLLQQVRSFQNNDIVLVAEDGNEWSLDIELFGRLICPLTSHLKSLRANCESTIFTPFRGVSRRSTLDGSIVYTIAQDDTSYHLLNLLQEASITAVDANETEDVIDLKSFTSGMRGIPLNARHHLQTKLKKGMLSVSYLWHVCSRGSAEVPDMYGLVGDELAIYVPLSKSDAQSIVNLLEWDVRLFRRCSEKDMLGSREKTTFSIREDIKDAHMALRAFFDMGIILDRLFVFSAELRNSWQLVHTEMSRIVQITSLRMTCLVSSGVVCRYVNYLVAQLLRVLASPVTTLNEIDQAVASFRASALDPVLISMHQRAVEAKWMPSQVEKPTGKKSSYRPQLLPCAYFFAQDSTCKKGSACNFAHDKDCAIAHRAELTESLTKVKKVLDENKLREM